jgi:spermidine/putrescine-binding protein
MEEESNPIKEYLFNYIEKSENRFQQLFSQTKMAEIINDILDNCYYKVTLMENKEESLGVLSTGILHYMLTNAMLTSQRKVECRGVEIDIVIPDLKTLEKDSKKTLIICIPKTLDKKIIQKKLEKLQNIQPEKQNIWLVLTQDLGFEYKTYVIQKEKSSFSNIIFDIAQFVNVQGHNKFKILRV